MVRQGGTAVIASGTNYNGYSHSGLSGTTEWKSGYSHSGLNGKTGLYSGYSHSGFSGTTGCIVVIATADSVVRQGV